MVKLARRPASNLSRAGRAEDAHRPRHARESEVEDFLTAQVRTNRAIVEAARGKTDIAAARALPKDLAEWQSTIEFVLGPFGIAQGSRRGLGDGLCQAANATARRSAGKAMARCWRRRRRALPVQLSTPVTGIAVGARPGSRNARKDVSRPRHHRDRFHQCARRRQDPFSPELPRRHLDAAARLKLGTYEHVALDMPGNPLGLAPDELVLREDRTAPTPPRCSPMWAARRSALSMSAGRFGAEHCRRRADGDDGFCAGLAGQAVWRGFQENRARHARRRNGSRTRWCSAAGRAPRRARNRRAAS